MRCAFSWATRPAAATSCGPHAGALTGGDIACVVAAPHSVRLLLGDVMGHDERAAQTAVEVVRAFRELAARPDPLQVVAARMHAFVADHADGEEFVTAQFISIPHGDEGDPQIVCCGHPPALLLRDGRVTLLDTLPPSPPLGLLDIGGYSPHADLLGTRPGDSVLLYTDGVSEACDANGRPYPLAERAAALSAQTKISSSYPEGSERLPELLRDDLLDHVGGALRDDATLLYLRFENEQTDARSKDESPAGSPTCVHCALLITFSPSVLASPPKSDARPERHNRGRSRHWGRRLPEHGDANRT